MLFNVSKTQFFHLSTRQNLPDNYPFYFDDTHLSPSSTLNILGLSFTKILNWKSHIPSLSKSAALYHLHKFFSSYQLLILYMGLIRPCMEYVSHVWDGFMHTELLNMVQSKDFCLIDSSPLILCWKVASLAIFYHYFHANCSSELANCMPRSHPYSVHLPYARVNQHLHTFFPSTGKLWNSLPESAFPLYYYLRLE